MKKIFSVGVALLLGVSCVVSACSDDKNCDGVELGCDGTVRIIACSGGEVTKEDCKDISPTALCSTFGFNMPTCYEPCTKEGDEEVLCIDHASDPESSYCEIKPGDTECVDVPEHRPNSWRYKTCVLDNGILRWDEGSDHDCFRDSSNSCCQVDGKACNSGYSNRCDETTNTVVFCNSQLLVEHKECGENPDPNDFECGSCI